ncbi:MAG: integrin alpha, partial [Patescibacteria group bacterium]
MKKKFFYIPLFFSLLFLPFILKAQDQFDLSEFQTKLVGEASGDSGNIGPTVTSAGDVNGDGYDDVLIGTSYNNTGGIESGAAYLIYGSDSIINDINLSSADVKFIGEEIADQAGISVASAGDVNGDNYDDIFIGAFNNDAGGSNAGAVYLIYGSDSLASSIDLSLADVKFIGEAANNLTGAFVASAGDVNGDGIDDILIGAPWLFGSGQLGTVYLIYGSDSLASSINLSLADVKFSGEEENDTAGISVASAGDVNNDEYDDILIGAYDGDDSDTDTGAVYLGYINMDVDGDGVKSLEGLYPGTDCNDNDESIQVNHAYYIDADHDTYGSTATASLCYGVAPTGYATNNTDCNDSSASIHSNQTYYYDADGDGLGSDTTTSACQLTA